MVIVSIAVPGCEQIALLAATSASVLSSLRTHSTLGLLENYSTKLIPRSIEVHVVAIGPAGVVGQWVASW